MPTARAAWIDGVRFLGTTGSGHTVPMAGPARDGQAGAEPTPSELVLTALCGCTGVVVANLLRMMKTPAAGLEVEATADHADRHPRVFTGIRLHYRVAGDVPEENLERAIASSEKTYCLVGAMLGQVAPVTHTYEIVPA